MREREWLCACVRDRDKREGEIIIKEPTPSDALVIINYNSRGSLRFVSKQEQLFGLLRTNTIVFYEKWFSLEVQIDKDVENLYKVVRTLVN